MIRERDQQAPIPEIDSAVLECNSVEEACERGAEMWGIEAEDIEASVLTEDKKFFGLLGANLRVEIRPFAPLSYIKSCHLLNDILERMDLDLVPELTDDGMINLIGEDAGVVIGRYGETLKALEYLTNLFVILICQQDEYVLTAEGTGTNESKLWHGLQNQWHVRPFAKGPLLAWSQCQVGSAGLCI